MHGYARMKQLKDRSSVITSNNKNMYRYTPWHFAKRRYATQRAVPGLTLSSPGAGKNTEKNTSRPPPSVGKRWQVPCQLRLYTNRLLVCHTYYDFTKRLRHTRYTKDYWYIIPIATVNQRLYL